MAGIANFIPELWEAAVQVPFEKALVYGQETVANRDYEGEIQQQGDTVNVTTIADPTIRTYDKNADIEIEDVSDGNVKMVIDQGDYYAFRVNDIDKVQAAGDFQSPALARAAFGLRDKVDKYIAGLAYAGADAANKVGRIAVVDAEPEYAGTGQTSAYAVLVKLREKLDDQSVPIEGRFVVVNPAFISALSYDPRFTNASASGTSETLRNGFVKQVQGFDVLVSNNVPAVGGAGADKDDKVIVAGVPAAWSFANQLAETEAIRQEKRFANLVRGLNIYGAKVFEPKGLATATVTFAAPAV